MPTIFSRNESGEEAEYHRIVGNLFPMDVPCIHCGHVRTHEHGTYERNPQTVSGDYLQWKMHRRLCPSCERTFSLLPSCLAPYQRVFISIQDAVASMLAGNQTYEQVLVQLKELGLTMTVGTMRRWFQRMSEQVEMALTRIKSWIHRTHQLNTPRLRRKVRNSKVCMYYDTIVQAALNSGDVNLEAGVIYMFAPSLSGNRVSYGFNPDFST